jgi:hypothetical protein
VIVFKISARKISEKTSDIIEFELSETISGIM